MRVLDKDSWFGHFSEAMRRAALPTYSNGETEPFRSGWPNNHSKHMSVPGSRRVTVLLCAALTAVSLSPAFGQASNGEQKPADQQKSDTGRDTAKRVDEIAEAGRLMTGPAANPECVWLGRRVVNLLWRDDLDTAFRHLEIYDRFGCPGGHVQASFRCLVRQGIDPNASETLNARVHACWINPTATPAAPAASAAPAPAAPAAPAGTGTR
jgi:hypothetical protein